MKSSVTKTKTMKGVYRSDRRSEYISLYKILGSNAEMVRIRKYYYYPDTGRINYGGQTRSLEMILLHTKLSFLNEIFKHKILDLSENRQNSIHQIVQNP